MIVAEEMKKPLYSMSAGELGHTAREVEERLHKVLELSTKWGAILLVDECDVFLEQRTTSDLERNKLVSGEMRCLTVQCSQCEKRANPDAQYSSVYSNTTRA